MNVLPVTTPFGKVFANSEDTLMRILKSFAHDETGATMVEYGLVVGLIAVVMVVMVTSVGAGTDALFRAGNSALTNSLNGAS